MNIQDEIIKIHAQYGTSEKSNYEIQKLFDTEIEKSKKEGFESGYNSALSSLNSNETKKYPVGVIGKNIQDSIELAKLNSLKPYDTRECVLLYRPEHFCSWIFSKIIMQVDKSELSNTMQNSLEIALNSQLE